nr:MAG TPA: hypothetical protein [Caudoviricetes sp.]
MNLLHLLSAIMFSPFGVKVKKSNSRYIFTYILFFTNIKNF